MNFIVISGLSGAGKTIAMHSLEDIGYYCVDNLPAQLLCTFYDLFSRSDDLSMKNVAVVIDTRGNSIDKLFSELITLKQENKPYKLLYLYADKEVINSRYNQTRRKHPLADKNSGSIYNAIEMEIELLEKIRSVADYVIDTGKLSSVQLKHRITTEFSSCDNSSELSVTCLSFGYKYGIPSESDLVFDVRCLPNPFYIDELKHKTGNDEPVYSYVMSFDESKGLLEKIIKFIDFSLPLYISEGKSQLTISIGCTGGKHRSVTIANRINQYLKNNNLKTNIYHRDIEKE